MASKVVVIFIFLSMGFSYNAKYGGELYRDGRNARNAALGGISVSYADGCNPVLLKNKNTHAIHFSNKNKFGGLSQVIMVSYLHPGKKYPFYFGLTKRSVDNIKDTRSAWTDNGNSVPESGEINYFNIHNIILQEIGIQLSTIRLWGPYTLGFNLKPNFTSLAEFRSYGISGDVAAMSQPIDKLDLTLLLEDIIGIKYWNTGTVETISPLFMGGLHYQFFRLSMGLELGYRIERNSILQYHLGIEYTQRRQLFFRLGTSHNNQFTAGFGLRLHLVDFSYAYLHPDEKSYFSESHIISVGININEIRRIKGKIKP